MSSIDSNIDTGSSDSTGSTGSTVVAEKFVRDRLQWLGYLLVGIYCFLIAAFGPIMPMVAHERNYDYTLTSYHFSGYALGVLIAGMSGDKFMGRFGRNNVLWGGVAGMVAGTATIIAAQYAIFSILGAFLVGLSGSVMGQVNTSIMADRFKEDRAIAITETNIVGSIFCSLAPLIVSLSVRFGLGWRAVLILPIVFVALLFLKFRTVASAYQKQAKRAAAKQNLPPLYWAFWAVVLLSVGGEWSIVFWCTDFMIKVNKFSDADAAAAVSVFLAAMLTGRIIGSRLTRSFHVRQLLPISGVIGLVGFLIFWLAKVPMLTLVGLFIAGLGESNVYPLAFASAIGAAHEHQTNSATSRLSLASGVANLSTPMLMGFIAERSNIFNAYGVTAILWLMVIIVVLVANKMSLARAH
jgi:MFS family permease